uniref:Peroxisomal 2,4-dienoyl-CoA reductase [(3E)-enoyl-CoA-producing] n=1 Tax=Bubo bubo TaxID=30461 RepID=A0A8C0FNR9_BUBBB
MSFGSKGQLCLGLCQNCLVRVQPLYLPCGDVAQDGLCLGLILPEGESPRKNLKSLIFFFLFLFFLQASKKLVAATGQQCLPLSIDVRQPQTIAAAVDEALKEFKRIDILINGAAGNFLCPASALSFNAFKTVIDIDTLGTFNTSKVLFEKYFRDHGGVIVNITATLSYRGQALQVHAGTAKAAIGGKFAEEASQFDMIPLQRAGNKTEIAHSTLYLASPLSSYVTGTTLVVDGGSWLTSANNFPALLGIASSSAKL